MKLLILTAFYPAPDGTHERMFVHVRDIFYQKNGIDVTVLNFAAKADYIIDGIKVITLDSYKKSRQNFDIAVFHSANLRNHYLFVKKYGQRFRRFVFFFHGHEMLYLTKDYPEPYSYMRKRAGFGKTIQNMYDYTKIHVWANFYKKAANKSDYVFVSSWMYRRFMSNTGLNEKDLHGKCHIINNSIGSVFESASYQADAEKKYDFITIRSNLDGSKYGVDLVVRMAEENPQCKFLLIGRGKYFEYNKKPNNLELISRTMDHAEMLDYLNASKCAILMTREDTQGVMTCELAAYGMPVITSDIEVCHEFFDDAPNIAMVSNEMSGIPIVQISKKLAEGVPYHKSSKYFAKNTIMKEIELYKHCVP